MRSLELSQPPGLAIAPSTRPDVLRAFSALCTAAESPVDPIDRECAAHRFLALAFTHADDHPLSGCAPAVARTRAAIHDGFADPLTLEELARDAGLSMYHLLRIFSEQVGVPIHRYLQLVRVERAMTLLRQGKSVADAAASCGFADQAHLTRTQRAFWGTTPGQYARAHRPARTFKTQVAEDVNVKASGGGLDDEANT
jgi:AraC-like DNA-binding protein